jgi:hypothetical protein
MARQLKDCLINNGRITELVMSPQRPNKLLYLQPLESFQNEETVYWYNLLCHIKDVDGYYSIELPINPAIIFNAFLSAFSFDSLPFNLVNSLPYIGNDKKSITIPEQDSVDIDNIFWINGQPALQSVRSSTGYFYDFYKTYAGIKQAGLFQMLYHTGLYLMVSNYVALEMEHRYKTRIIFKELNIQCDELRQNIDINIWNAIQLKQQASSLNVKMEWIDASKLEYLANYILNYGKDVFSSFSMYYKFVEDFPEFWKNWALQYFIIGRVFNNMNNPGDLQIVKALELTTSSPMKRYIWNILGYK